MKILFILDAIPADQVGGIAKSINTEIVALAARGHEVRVLTRRQIRGTAEREIIDGVAVVRLRGPLRGSPTYYIHPWVTMRRAPKLIERICKDWSADVAYVHSSFLANGLARAKISARKVFCYHAPAAEEIGIDADGGKYGVLSWLARRAIKSVVSAENTALHGMDSIFTRSAFMRERLVAAHPEFATAEITSCPIMVDTDYYQFAESSRSARLKLALPSERPILLCVRRLVNRMGLPEILETVKILRREHPEVLLLIAGKGYMQSQLEDLIVSLGIADNVRLLGFVAEADLPTYFASSTLCVVPSVALEGFGLVSLEAMSSGRVVVATPVGGNVEVVGGLGSEYLTQGSTPHQLAAGISHWLALAEDASLRKNIRGHCVAQFGLTVVASRLESLLAPAGCLDSRSRRAG